MTKTERYTITVEAISSPNDAPPIVRLRRALKCLLRAFRLRVVRIEPTSDDDETTRETA